jgi:hypothetical protein
VSVLTQMDNSRASSTCYWSSTELVSVDFHNGARHRSGGVDGESRNEPRSDLRHRAVDKAFSRSACFDALMRQRGAFALTSALTDGDGPAISRYARNPSAARRAVDGIVSSLVERPDERHRAPHARCLRRRSNQARPRYVDPTAIGGFALQQKYGILAGKTEEGRRHDASIVIARGERAGSSPTTTW